MIDLTHLSEEEQVQEFCRLAEYYKTTDGETEKLESPLEAREFFRMEERDELKENVGDNYYVYSVIDGGGRYAAMFRGYKLSNCFHRFILKEEIKISDCGLWI